MFPEAGDFEARNSLILAVTVVVGKHSRNTALLRSDILDFAMLPAQIFSLAGNSFFVRCHVTSK